MTYICLYSHILLKSLFFTVPVCTLFDVPLLTDIAEKTVGRAILNNGVINDGTGFFWKDAYLVLPAFIMNDFQDRIQIDLDFMYRNPKSDEIAVLSNANCNLAPTVSFILKDALSTDCYLEVTMKLQNVSDVIRFKAPVVSN